MLWLAILLTACSGADPCDEAVDSWRCSSDEVLEECVDGRWQEAEYCADDGLQCHAEMGHCMDL